MTKQDCNAVATSTQVKRRPARSKRYTNKEYIEAAVAVHGDYFGYDKVEYITSKVKVEIYCPHCQDYFWQGAGAHLGGYGCGRCRVRKISETKQLTTADFIAKAVKTHGSKYSYEKVVYVNNTTHVIITCLKHGDFKQSPSSHTTGRGCKHCRAEFISKTLSHNIDDFLRIAKSAHPEGKYSYDKAVYTGSGDMITITCDVHGDFEQKANDHKMGRGCAKCGWSTGGFQRSDFQEKCDKHHNGLGYLYVIKCFNDTEVFYKVGITSIGVKVRFAGHLMPYNYKLVYEVFNNGVFIYDLETQLHRLLSDYQHKPNISFGGETECFTTIKPIEKLLKRLSTTEQLQLLA